MNNYEDIINLERPKSNHSHLSVESRAAQFAPFAALVGYDSAIKETARITDKRIEIDDELKVIISNKLNYLNDHIKDNNKVIITYFIKDEKKSGGNYIHKTGIIKNINPVESKIKFTDNSTVYINDIINIEILKDN